MTEYRYKAFISYSHADERAGQWLHDALETYKTPGNLVGKATHAGPIPKRLTPIFRDQDDLPAAGNLNDTIIDALKNSQFLVVLASPNAVRSKWVQEEIKSFKQFHGPDRVLAIIIDGEPFASDNPGVDNSLECFPEPLRFNQENNGPKLPAEPLAADARVQNDKNAIHYAKSGKKAAITKLAAGLIGVPLDDLVQREAQRNARRLQLITGVSVFAGLVFGGLALFAFDQRAVAENERNEAEIQRSLAEKKTAEAEGLIDFMITDLRKGVEEEVGRLDALEPLGGKALEYYADQDVETLDADALGRRSRALHFAGEIERQKNNLETALSTYQQAAETTAQLLAQDPQNPERVFEHAQSVFYVGHIHRQRGNIQAAEIQMREYLALAESLNKIEPGKTRSIKELYYANNNLGVMKRDAGEYDLAVSFFQQSADARKKLMTENPEDDGLAFSYATALTWQATTETDLGNFTKAATLFSEEIEIYNNLLEKLPQNYRYLSARAIATRRLSNALYWTGNTEQALSEIRQADRQAQQILQRDPANTSWQLNAAQCKIKLAALTTESNNNADQLMRGSLELIEKAMESGSANIVAKEALIKALSGSLNTQPDQDTADRIYENIQPLFKHDTKHATLAIGEGSLRLAQYYDQLQNVELSNTISRKAIAHLESKKNLPAETTLSLLGLYIQTKELENAKMLLQSFDENKVQHPHYVAMREELSR